MTLQEKVHYHQVHPLKLATDISAQIVAIYLFWVHSLIAGLIVMFVPPVIASLIIINTVDLSPYKNSALGRYLKRYMTRAMEAVRLAGTLPMVLGAWYRLPWLIPLGLGVTLLGWFRGVLFPARTEV